MEWAKNHFTLLSLERLRQGRKEIFRRRAEVDLQQ
jgi:hypothetical protein